MNKTVWIIVLVVIVAAAAWYFYFAPQGVDEVMEDANTEQNEVDAMMENDNTKE